MEKLRGGLSTPLFFLALAFAGAGSYYGSIAFWAASVLMLAAARKAERSEWGFSWLGLAAAAYAAAVMLSVFATSSAYTAAGLFHPLMLALSYLVLRGCAHRDEKAIAYATGAFGLVVGAWGLLQIGFLGVARASAFFETPATYAVVLSLILVPRLAAVAAGKREAAIIFAAAFLAAAVFAAESRGALLALAAGTGSVAILGMRARLLQWRGVARVALLLAVGWAAVLAIRSAPAFEAPSVGVTARAESSISRLELFALSWKARREQPLAGSGYLTFGYILEQGRAQVPSYGESHETAFVHNDYLQTLLELGPVGLLALLGLTVLPPVQAYRRLPVLAEDQRLPVVASASALLAMSVHALVDFPFYVPACLLLYGALLGTLDRRLNAATIGVPHAWHSTRWYRPMRAAALTIAAVLLLRPVAAEIAAEWGLRKSIAGDAQSTAFWLAAAQRIEPRDWRYHWYAGQFWELQATQSGRREAARMALQAYAAGFDANPLEVRNLLGLISMHRRHRALLDAPVGRDTLQAWLAQAEALAPFNRAVRSERAWLGAAK